MKRALLLMLLLAQPVGAEDWPTISTGYTVLATPQKPPGNYCEVELWPGGIAVGSHYHEGGSYTGPWSSILPLDDAMQKVCEWAATSKQEPKILIFNKKEIWRSDTTNETK